MKPRKVTRSRQVTLPKDWCERNGITEGAWVDVRETEAGLLMVPVELTPRKINLGTVLQQAETDYRQGNYTRLSSPSAIDEYLDAL